MRLSMGHAAEKSTCTQPASHNHPKVGLPAPLRSTAGRRYCRATGVTRLGVIRRAWDFDLEISQVRDLPAANEATAACFAVDRIAVEDHIRMLRFKRAELTALGAILSRCDVRFGTALPAPCGDFEDFKLPTKAAP